MTLGLAEVLAREFTKFLQPVVDAAESDERIEQLFAAVGWDIGAITGFPVTKLTNTLSQFMAAYQNVLTWIETPPETLEAFGQVLDTILGTFEAIRSLSMLMNDPQLVRPPQFEDLGRDLVNWLTIEYLQRHHPVAYDLGGLLTLIEVPGAAATVEYVVDTTQRILRARRPQPALRLDRVGQLLGDPVAVLKSEYVGQGLSTIEAAQATADKLFPRLANLLSTLGVRAIYGLRQQYGLDFGTGGNEIVARSMAFLVPLGGASSQAKANFGAVLTLAPADRGDFGLVVRPFGTLDLAEMFGAWKIDATLKLASGVEGFAVKPGSLTLSPPPATPNVQASITAIRLVEEGKPALLLGGATETRLEVGKLAITATMGLDSAQQDYGVLIELASAALVVAPSNGDSFLQRMLPDVPFVMEFDGALGWSNRQGIHFRGSGVLEATYGIHSSVGLLSLELLHLALKPTANRMVLEVSVSGSAALGPLAVSVGQLGLLADIEFKQGNLGVLNLALRFKPPNGLGIIIDAGPVTGGGFISFDDAKGRYAGVLFLRAGEIVIKAIGLLDTRLPGGRPGYSFLVIITAQFPPIQLGYGFTLNGVGGLAGIHRTMVTEALQGGIRSHSVDHVLFPEDPIRDAPQIISDLSTIFPPAEGRYVFGPMALIGYGTPPLTLMTAELGILLELPDPVRLVLLGQLHAILPRKEEPVVELHLDVLGVIDFGKKTLAIDAVLHDSKLAEFDLYGDMALRLAWGKQPVFVLSVGGFHPAFQPPPAFPELRRLTLALGDGGNPRLTLQTYLALTSNTLQFGALAELYAEGAGFNLSGWLGFDVLVVLSPFSLLAELGATMALRRGSILVASVSLAATLTGPTPWHLWGQATLDAIIDVTVAFDVTIGPDVEEKLPDLDPSHLLKEELDKPGNWSATLPPAGARVVSLAPPPVSRADPLLDPLGGATVRQRVVPLNRSITKFGEANPLGPGRYAVSGVSVGGATASVPPMVQEFFAPAQFEAMSDAAKLSRPSFEKMDAGFTIASNAVAVGDAIGTDVVFNTLIVDQPNVKPPQYPLSEAHQRAVLARSASARAPLATTGEAKFAPAPTAKPLVALQEEDYQIVDVDTLSIEPGALAEPASKGAAYQALAAHLTTHPAKRGRLQVVPLHEVAA